MKILFLSRGYPPQLVGGGGGIATYTGCMAPILAARGHEVHVLSCMPNQEHADYLDQGVHVHRRGVSFRGPWLVRRTLRVLRAPRTIQRIRQGLSTFHEYRRLGIDFDVIEYPDWFAEGWLFALLRPRPLVSHLHGPLPVVPKFEQLPITRDIRHASSLEHFAVRRADVITSPSEINVRILRDLGWLVGRHVEVVPSAVDSHRWAGTGPAGDAPPTVLYLGRIERKKGPGLLVEAMSLIRRKLPEAQALFVGASSGYREGLPYIEWVKKSAADLTGCEFVGQVARQELADIFSKTRVFTLPSRWDNFPMAVCEAMAAGRPAVVTDCQGVAELVEQAGAGRVVPTEDSKALAEALLPYLEDAAYAAREGEKARAAVQELLDPDRIAAKRETVYQQAIAHFHQARAASASSILTKSPESKRGVKIWTKEDKSL